MALVIFDLDNTLLEGDCDELWGEFLVERRLVDGDHYRQQKQRFFEQYRQGGLDIDEFYRFVLDLLKPFGLVELFQLRHRFLKGDIRYRVRPKALSLIKQHLGNGDHVMVITATNSFIASEVVKLFGISDYIATEPEVINDRFTGNVSGTAAFGEGKYLRLLEWLEDKDYSLADASFYSDSHHDIPLLGRVGNPVVVNPDAILKDHATINGWVSLDLSMAMPGVADVRI